MECRLALVSAFVEACSASERAHILAQGEQAEVSIHTADGRRFQVAAQETDSVGALLDEIHAAHFSHEQIQGLVLFAAGGASALAPTSTLASNGIHPGNQQSPALFLLISQKMRWVTEQPDWHPTDPCDPAAQWLIDDEQGTVELHADIGRTWPKSCAYASTSATSTSAATFSVKFLQNYENGASLGLTTRRIARWLFDGGSWKSENKGTPMLGKPAASASQWFATIFADNLLPSPGYHYDGRIVSANIEGAGATGLASYGKQGDVMVFKVKPASHDGERTWFLVEISRRQETHTEIVFSRVVDFGEEEVFFGVSLAAPKCQLQLC
jgi:hypothetical protein